MEKKKEKSEPLPRGQTPAAESARNDFEKRYEEELKNLMNIPMSILVWGPNPSSDTPVAKKRIEIKEALLREGFYVIFSEEASNVSTPYPLGERTKERAQALSVHLIIALIEGSPGAQGEVHDFCDQPDIAPKMYVMAPQKYKDEDGYPAKGALKELAEGYGGVYWYDRSELESCNVLTMAMTRARARRHILKKIQAWHEK